MSLPKLSYQDDCTQVGAYIGKAVGFTLDFTSKCVPPLGLVIWAVAKFILPRIGFNEVLGVESTTISRIGIKTFAGGVIFFLSLSTLQWMVHAVLKSMDEDKKAQV